MLLVGTLAVAVLSIDSWLNEFWPPSPAVLTLVVAWAVLSNSLPSGTTSAGSILTVFWYVPGVSGAKTVTWTTRVSGMFPTPPVSGMVLTVPEKSPPVQVTVPPVAAPSWVQKNASVVPGPASVSKAEMKREPVGRKSWRTTLLTGSVPSFAAVIV